MNINEILQELNLKKAEADFYLANLQLGKATATQIAKRAKIERTYIYDIARSLQRKNLIQITFLKGKKQFIANSPDELLRLQEIRLKALRDILPQLKSLERTSGERPKISYYEGLDGMEQAIYDAMQYKGEIVGFTTPKFVSTENGKWVKKFADLRIKRGITTRFIGAISKEIQLLHKQDKEQLRETRMLPQDFFQSNIEILIYGNNKVLIINYEQLFAVIIESSDVNLVLKQIFELIWRGGFVIN